MVKIPRFNPCQSRQIMCSLVWKVDRDGTGIGICFEDCVSRIGREACDSNGSPAPGDRQGCRGKPSSHSPVVNEHRLALRAGDYDRPSSVACNVSGGNAVRPATPRQSERRTRHGVEATVAVTEQDGDGIFSRIGNIALIRDHDEIRVSVAVDVIDGNLPWFGARRER